MQDIDFEHVGNIQEERFNIVGVVDNHRALKDVIDRSPEEHGGIQRLRDRGRGKEILHQTLYPNNLLLDLHIDNANHHIPLAQVIALIRAHNPIKTACLEQTGADPPDPVPEVTGNFPQVDKQDEQL